QVSHLAGQRRSGVAVQLALELGQLLAHLGERPGAVRPVEPDRARLLLNTVGCDQRRQALRLLAEQRALIALLASLDLLPLTVGGLAVLHRGVAEHVRMAPDELGRGALEGSREVRSSTLGQELEAEHRQEAEVAELLGDVIRVARRDGLARL